MNTLDPHICWHFIRKWEGKPDRKGAVRDMRKDLNHAELAELYAPAPPPDIEQVKDACWTSTGFAFALAIGMMIGSLI